MKRSRTGRREHGKWMPLTRDHHVPMSPEKIAEQVAMAQRIQPDISESAIREIIDEQFRSELWVNDLYVVSLIRHEGAGPDCEIIQLSIRRRDRAPSRDWRHFQRIKNQLVGPECEGVELYPAESRVVDTANQFHIWCVADPKYRWPVGYFDRAVSSESGGGAVQRPREEADEAYRLFEETGDDRLRTVLG